MTTGAPVVEEAKPAVVAALKPGTPEHDAAMAKKFDESGGKPAAVIEPATKPEGVPDKFWNATTGAVDYAAWGKSTAELETAFTKSKQAPTDEGKKPATEEKSAGLKIDKPAEGADPAAALADKGLDINEFNTEFAAKGELGEESYAKLAKVGFDKATVDSVIAGQVALAEKRDNEGFAVAGGKEEFAKMSSWAAANMTAAEREAFNAAVSSPSVETMKLAVSGLRSRYEAVNGKAPTLVGGQPSSNSDVGFASTAEMTAAMRDPRYKKDTAYRASVEAKVAASKF